MLSLLVLTTRHSGITHHYSHGDLKKYYLAHLNIQIFLVPVHFFFSFEGKKEEKNRSDVISFSRILMKKKKQGQVILWHINALDLI